jgi:hypothetical protein
MVVPVLALNLMKMPSPQRLAIEWPQPPPQGLANKWRHPPQRRPKHKRRPKDPSTSPWEADNHRTASKHISNSKITQNHAEPLAQKLDLLFGRVKESMAAGGESTGMPYYNHDHASYISSMRSKLERWHQDKLICLCRHINPDYLPGVYLRAVRKSVTASVKFLPSTRTCSTTGSIF